MRFASLNIEGKNHFDRFIPFFQNEYKPDVLCLQEVMERDVPMIERELGMHLIFTPMADVARTADIDRRGLAMLTNRPLANVWHEIYSPFQAPDLIDEEDRAHPLEAIVFGGTYENEEGAFHVTTTHFTHTPVGEIIPIQQSAMASLLRVLSSHTDLILCGDFNTPRGDALWDTELSGAFTDNIPPDVISTVDPILHRRNAGRPGHLKLVIDGLFTCGRYVAKNVRIQDGLSDHCGVLADISLATETPA